MKTWVEAVTKELGLDILVDVDALLDVARIAAHTIERPAAPVTTFLVGVAVAQGANVDEACRTVSALAKSWSPKE